MKKMSHYSKENALSCGYDKITYLPQETWCHMRSLCDRSRLTQENASPFNREKVKPSMDSDVLRSLQCRNSAITSWTTCCPSTAELLHFDDIAVVESGRVFRLQKIWSLEIKRNMMILLEKMFNSLSSPPLNHLIAVHHFSLTYQKHMWKASSVSG